MQQQGNYSPPIEAYTNIIWKHSHHCLHSAHRLDLNLRSGKSDEDNIVLNLSVDFHENAITRNSRINGEWGVIEREENIYASREDDSLNPIIAGNTNCINRRNIVIHEHFSLFSGEIFKFYILIGDQKFHIAVNNQQFCTYNFRLPPESIRTVQLEYDLQFVTQVDHRSVFPSPHPPVQFDDARNIFSNDVPKPFNYGNYRRNCHSNIENNNLILYYRPCDSNNWNTIWKSKRMVLNQIHRSRIEASSTSL